MLHHPPKLSYRGLTIVLSNASRFDLDAKPPQLLSGNAGLWFNDECLRPAMNRWMCDIMDVEHWIASKGSTREGTKVILCLGERAQQVLMNVEAPLCAQRGSPVVRADGIVLLSSFSVQDTHDITNFEGKLNPLLRGEDVPDEADDEDEGYGKSRHGRTARSNYRYWVMRDVKKAIRMCTAGLIPHPQMDVNIYPSSEEVIEELEAHKGEDFYLDIETDSDLNISCFGFSFGDNGKVFVVPLLRYTYEPAYSALGRIMLALCRAMHYNRTVAHNGAGFDFFVIPFKYGIPFGRELYDTMVAHHRCFPGVEKSLGHIISNFTDLPFHKDEGIFEPQSQRQEEALWMYNAKDVYSMREAKRGMESYAQGIKGMMSSINQANASIGPYLTATMQGIAYRPDVVDTTVKTNNRTMNCILNLIETLVSRERLKEIRGKSQSSLPSSSSQCVKYFHGICGYPVQGYGKTSAKTGKKSPSLNEKNFLKLAIKLEEKGIKNPVVDLVLAYRGLAKESSMLAFNPWPGIRRLR